MEMKMGKLPKKYSAAFYEAQDRIEKTLAPYHPRCMDQTFLENGAIERYLVCSKGADAGEGRHQWRGVVSVHYNYDVKRCSVMLSFSEGMVAQAVGFKFEDKWGDTEALLAKMIPNLAEK